MEKIQQYLGDNPLIYGIFLFLLGGFFLFGAIFDWHWIFGNVSPVNYDLGKVDGLVNFFGRKTSRVLFAILSILVMAGGLVWFFIHLKH